MIKLYLLIILPQFLTNLNLGNTENGLGMVIGASGEMTQIGIFEKGETNTWSIFSFKDEGYYLEKIGKEENGNFIKIEYVSPNKYDYEVSLNSELKQGTLSKNKRLKFIRKERKKLLNNLRNKYPNITFKKNSIIEKTGSGKVQIKFKRDGKVIFIEKQKGEKANIYIQQMI